MTLEEKAKIDEALKLAAKFGYKLSIEKVENAEIDMNDGVISKIMENGWIENRKLFRRWITAQTLRLIGWNGKESYNEYTTSDWTYNFNKKFNGLYQFTYIVKEFETLAKIEKKDPAAFEIRKQFFTKDTLKGMWTEYYNVTFRKWVLSRKVLCSKKKPHIYLNGSSKLYLKDLDDIIERLCKNLDAIDNMTSYDELIEFNRELRRSEYFKINAVKHTKCSRAFTDAYKGSGAYYTMDNLVKFSGLKLVDMDDNILERDESLKYLEEMRETVKANPITNYQLLGLLQNSIKATNFKFTEVLKK